MKKSFLKLALVALTVGLLGSCAKINDRIDSLEGRIDRIESDRIASIDQQIAAINSSISDLGTIRQNIQNLIDTTDGQEKDINSLKTADASLGQRIDELKAYTDETLKAYAKSDWVKATFATLEQHEWTCDTVAKIDARIGKLDKKLTEAIEDSKESLRSWVNTQMESYYTAAQMDAKLAELLSKITTASGEGQAKADSLAKELKEAKSAIATVKTELTEAYQSAIEKAIKTSEGKLSSRISSSVSSVNSKVSALADRVDDLEDEVNNLTNRIKALEGRIQSVTIIPAYNDGSIKYGDDENSLTINCIISPSSLVANLTQSAFTVLYREVKTKSGDNTLTITGFSKDQTSGIVTLNANIPTGVPASGKSLFVAVNVRNDESDLTTNFVPVVVNVTSVSLNKTELELPLPGTETLTATVLPENATNKEVTWTSSVPTVATVDATGKVTAVAAGTATITATTVDGSKTANCAVIVKAALPEGALAGKFTVNADGKTVHFSQGNLYAQKTGDNWTWHFYDKQYKYNSLSTGISRTALASDTEIDLFTWGYDNTSTNDSYSLNPVNTAGISGHTTDGDKQFSASEDWGYVFGGESSVWRTLTTAEWQYLFNTRSFNGTTGEGKSYQRALINFTGEENNVEYGMILYPDNYTSQTSAVTYTSAEWSSMESAGCVFLPAAGSRDGSDVILVGFVGVYWSSTAFGSFNAYRVNFSSDLVYPDYNYYRLNGYSVRLITESK